MYHAIALKILGSIFGWIFKSAKNTTDDEREDMFTAVKALARMGGKKTPRVSGSCSDIYAFCKGTGVGNN